MYNMISDAHNTGRAVPTMLAKSVVSTRAVVTPTGTLVLHPFGGNNVNQDQLGRGNGGPTAHRRGVNNRDAAFCDRRVCVRSCASAKQSRYTHTLRGPGVDVE